MIHKKTETREVTVEVHTCDDCGAESTSHCYIHTCSICRADVCDSTCSHTEWDGDFKTVYCKTCWQIGEPYRNAIADRDFERDREVKKENAAWAAKGKAERAKKGSEETK